MHQLQRFTFLALATLLLGTAFSIAQEKGGAELDMAAIMQAMQPGPHHKAMDLLAHMAVGGPRKELRSKGQKSDLGCRVASVVSELARHRTGGVR